LAAGTTNAADALHDLVAGLAAGEAPTPVLGPGKLGERRKLNDDGCDGFAIDEHGNLYGTPKAPLVRIWDPVGTIIGEIPLPDSASNVTFGGPDRKILFMTVKDKVFALPMKVSGGG
jgi:gluconolactonase